MPCIKPLRCELCRSDEYVISWLEDEKGWICKNPECLNDLEGYWGEDDDGYLKWLSEDKDDGAQGLLASRAPSVTSKAGPATCQPSVLDLLLPELLGKVFSYLEDEERCQTIPLVCRAWQKIHIMYPPIRKSWCAGEAYRNNREGVTKPMVTWFLKIASHVETLQTCSSGRHPSYLPQLLTLAALAAPNLRILSIDVSRDAPSILHAVAFLSQIKDFTLYGMCFQRKTMDHGLAGLSGLSSLKSVIIEGVDLRGAKTSDGDALWRSLASLKHLTRLHFNTVVRETHIDRPAAGVHVHFFDSVSLLTNIRPLETFLHPEPPALPVLHTLGLVGSYMDEKIGLETFPESFAAKLVSLVKLNLSNNKLTVLPPSIAHLSALQELDLSYNNDIQLHLGDEGILLGLDNLRTLSLSKSSSCGCECSWTSKSMQTLLSIVRMYPGLAVIA